MANEPASGLNEVLYLLEPGTTRDDLSSPPVSFGIPYSPGGVDSAPKQSAMQTKILDGNPNPRRPSKSRIDASGSIKVPLGWTWIPHILRHWLGTATITGLSDPYTYDGEYGTGLPVGFHLERYNADKATAPYRFIRACRPTSFGGMLDVDGIVYFDCGYQGESVDAWSASSLVGTPTVYTDDPVSHLLGTVEIDDSTVADISKFSINLNHSTQTDGYSLGQAGKRNKMAIGQGEVTGSVEMWLSDDSAAYIVGAEAQTEYKFAIKWDESATRYLHFTWSQCNLFLRGEPVDTDQGLRVLFDIVSFRSAADGTAFEYDMQTSTPGLA